jgi:hypothetical protein
MSAPLAILPNLPYILDMEKEICMHNETMKIKAFTVAEGYACRIKGGWEKDNPYREGTLLGIWWDHGFLMADSDLDAEEDRQKALVGVAK